MIEIRHRETGEVLRSFEGETLQKAVLSGARLSGADLAGADLRRADLRGARLDGAALEGANLAGADCSDPSFAPERAMLGVLLIAPPVLFMLLPRQYSAPAYALLGCLFLAYFARFAFTCTRLEGARLAGARLGEANLMRAVLRQADLSGADLRGANLKSANLSGADLRGADLTGAEMRYTVLIQARYDEGTRWPDGVDPGRRGALLVQDCVPAAD